MTPTGKWSLYSAGIRLKVPSTGGLRIGPSLNYSLVISNTTGSDGIRILDTGDDAIQIGSNPDIPNYGVYIPSGSTPLPLVVLADSQTYTGVIGVVKSRMVWEVAPGKEQEGEMSMHSADGPAQPDAGSISGGSFTLESGFWSGTFEYVTYIPIVKR